MPDTTPRTTTLDLRGPYDLGEVALMGFGHRDEQSFDGVLRLAFGTDADPEHQVGVEVRQPDPQRLTLTVHDGPGEPADLRGVAAQVARVVSADHDGAAFEALCRADLVLAPVHAVAPGFRPALFHSAYDACTWSVLSARRHRRQAIGLRARLSERHGTGFDLAGQRLHALPSPRQLLGLEEVAGLQQAAVPRLHAVAQAGLEGRLDTERLRGLDPDAASDELQTLPGIGPFYATLVVVRALGHADVLAVDESHVRAVVRERFGLDHDPGAEELTELAVAWRPFRTWVTVMLRALHTRAPRSAGDPGDSGDPVTPVSRRRIVRDDDDLLDPLPAPRPRPGGQRAGAR